MIILTILVAVLAAILFLPTLSDLLSLLRVMVLPGRGKRGAPDRLPRFLVVVPAHNEELLIESCVRSLLGMDYPADHRRVVVVADNCSDRTAELVRGAGGSGLERHDLESGESPPPGLGLRGAFRLAEYDAVLIVGCRYAGGPRLRPDPWLATRRWPTGPSGLSTGCECPDESP